MFGWFGGKTKAQTAHRLRAHKGPGFSEEAMRGLADLDARIGATARDCGRGFYRAAMRRCRSTRCSSCFCSMRLSGLM